MIKQHSKKKTEDYEVQRDDMHNLGSQINQLQRLTIRNSFDGSSVIMMKPSNQVMLGKRNSNIDVRFVNFDSIHPNHMVDQKSPRGLVAQTDLASSSRGNESSCNVDDSQLEKDGIQKKQLTLQQINYALQGKAQMFVKQQSQTQKMTTISGAMAIKNPFSSPKSIISPLMSPDSKSNLGAFQKMTKGTDFSKAVGIANVTRKNNKTQFSEVEYGLNPNLESTKYNQHSTVAPEQQQPLVHKYFQKQEVQMTQKSQQKIFDQRKSLDLIELKKNLNQKSVVIPYPQTTKHSKTQMPLKQSTIITPRIYDEVAEEIREPQNPKVFLKKNNHHSNSNCQQTNMMNYYFKEKEEKKEFFNEIFQKQPNQIQRSTSHQTNAFEQQEKNQIQQILSDPCIINLFQTDAGDTESQNVQRSLKLSQVSIMSQSKRSSMQIGIGKNQSIISKGITPLDETKDKKSQSLESSRRQSEQQVPSRNISEIRKKMFVQSILLNDLGGFRKAVELGDVAEIIDSQDFLGNTPLMLGVKLLGSNRQFEEIFKEILKLNPNPFLKNRLTNWSALDEALSQRSVLAVALIFQQCYKHRRNSFDQQKEKILTVLKQFEDFSIEMNWNFDSPLPFIKSLAPSDVVKLWKSQNSLRVDSTLVGFQNLKCKRRDNSLLFRGLQIPNFIQINKTNGIFCDPLEELDIEERKFIIHDLLDCEPYNGNLDIVDCQFVESQTWRGKKVFQIIDGLETEKYDLKLTYKTTLVKKQKDTQEKFRLEKQLYDSWLMDQRGADNLSEETLKKLQPTNKKEQTEKSTISIWIRRNFPLKFKDFNNIITFLAKGNHLLDKLAKVFERPEIQDMMKIDGFPLKIQIPFQFSIHATISFTNYQKLLQNDPRLFSIPHNVALQPRKEYQRTMEKKSKRMLLANLYL